MEKSILAAIKDYGKAATWVIANRIGMRGQTMKVLSALKQMEADGLVQRHSNSSPNNYVWVKAS